MMRSVNVFDDYHNIKTYTHRYVNISTTCGLRDMWWQRTFFFELKHNEIAALYCDHVLCVKNFAGVSRDGKAILFYFKSVKINVHIIFLFVYRRIRLIA